MPDSHSTIEVARMLDLSVRSVQLMVDRGELTAWKTPGGHRRILRESVDQWLAQRGLTEPMPLADPAPAGASTGRGRPARSGGAARAGSGGAEPPRILLIEDSRHFQNLISLLVRQHFPEAELHLADDGFAGLAMAGRLRPDVLLVDLLLPGIDGATLIGSLSQHPQFQGMRLVVVTSLDADQREPYAYALRDVPVVHKPDVVAQLPGLLRQALPARRAHG